jgi:hypothetical protein
MADIDKTTPPAPPTAPEPAPVKKTPACPVCKAPLDVYTGSNPFKVGTGWCPAHDRQPLGG